MTDTTLPASGLRVALRHLWQDQRVWLASALILAALALNGFRGGLASRSRSG
jgi:hypothetical protein